MRLSLVLLAVALALAGGVTAWGLSQPRLGETGEYVVEAHGPDGPLFSERARVPEATALSALQVAAAQAGYALTLEEYHGMGTYVRAIGGHTAGGASGWIYEVHRAGEWISGDRSASYYALQKDDAVRWTWTRG